MTALIETLSRVEAFSLLTPKDLSLLAPCLRPVHADAGEVLFREGDAGDALFVVVSGRVTLSIRLPDGTDRELASFGPGAAFGEMSIFERAPRSGTCTAAEPSDLYSLPADEFFGLMERAPATANRVMFRLLNVTASRLRRTRGLVSEMVLWGEQASRRAVTDERTGLYNRRFLDDTLESYLAEARSTGRPFAFVMSDLDRFRLINETYGTEAGDKAIVAAAAAIRAELGENGAAARYGGDEFVLILPGATKDDALSLCDRIRGRLRTVAAPLGPRGEPVHLTTSQGVAVYPDDARDAETLKARADAALYRAKEAGRDRAVWCGEHGV